MQRAQKKRWKRWIGGMLAVAMLGATGCASQGPETPQTEVDGPMVYDGEIEEDREFSDEEIETFAAAYVEVTAIQQDYQRRMQEAEGAERQALGQESSQRAEEAMAAHGLTSQEFNEIAVRLPQDEDLRSRVQAAVQEMEAERIRETEEQLD